MPNLDGVSACHLIRQFSSTPVIAMTSNIRSDDIEMYFRHGMFDLPLERCLPLTFQRHERRATKAFHKRRASTHAREASRASQAADSRPRNGPASLGRPPSILRSHIHERRRITCEITRHRQHLELTRTGSWRLASSQHGRRRIRSRPADGTATPKHVRRAESHAAGESNDGRRTDGRLPSATTGACAAAETDEWKPQKAD